MSSAHGETRKSWLHPSIVAALVATTLAPIMAAIVNRFVEPRPPILPPPQTGFYTYNEEFNYVVKELGLSIRLVAFYRPDLISNSCPGPWYNAVPLKIVNGGDKPLWEQERCSEILVGINANGDGFDLEAEFGMPYRLEVTSANRIVYDGKMELTVQLIANLGAS